MKVYLVGLPGSGKSTLGKQIAQTLSIPFVDLDHEIEASESKPVKDIFNEQGEEYFRDLEAKTLLSWAFSEKSFVMATGGGAPCFNNGMEVINESGISVFLDVPIDAIAKRIQEQNLPSRPLLIGEDVTSKLEKLKASRQLYYQQAHFTLRGERITAQEILDRIY